VRHGLLVEDDAAVGRVGVDAVYEAYVVGCKPFGHRAVFRDPTGRSSQCATVSCILERKAAMPGSVLPPAGSRALSAMTLPSSRTVAFIRM
jgi:hypothetical protein